MYRRRYRARRDLLRICAQPKQRPLPYTRRRLRCQIWIQSVHLVHSAIRLCQLRRSRLRRDRSAIRIRIQYCKYCELFSSNNKHPDQKAVQPSFRLAVYGTVRKAVPGPVRIAYPRPYASPNRAAQSIAHRHAFQAPHGAAHGLAQPGAKPTPHIWAIFQAEPRTIGCAVRKPIDEPKRRANLAPDRKSVVSTYNHPNIGADGYPHRGAVGATINGTHWAAKFRTDSRPIDIAFS